MEGDIKEDSNILWRFLFLSVWNSRQFETPRAHLTWKRHWGGMKGCPEFGCLRLSNLKDAKEICIQDKTCNGVVSCPYSECHVFEIRRGPILTANHWPNLELKWCAPRGRAEVALAR